MKVESGVEFVGVSEIVQYVVLSAVLRVISPEVAKRNTILRRSELFALHSAGCDFASWSTHREADFRDDRGPQWTDLSRI